MNFSDTGEIAWGGNGAAEMLRSNTEWHHTGWGWKRSRPLIVSRNFIIVKIDWPGEIIAGAMEEQS
jgi:hypothetical protein